MSRQISSTSVAPVKYISNAYLISDHLEVMPRTKNQEKKVDAMDDEVLKKNTFS